MVLKSIRYASSLVGWTVVLPSAMLAATVLTILYGSYVVYAALLPLLLLLEIGIAIGSRGGRLLFVRGMRHLNASSILRPVTVGSGWGFVLNGGDVVGSSSFRVAPSGYHRRTQRWRAGTSIATLQRHLRKRGQTLTGHPSLLSATLGGWIFTGSHGSGGTLWRSSMGRVTVRDEDTGEVVDATSKKVFFTDARTMDQQRRYTVMEVEILPAKDVRCERIAFDVHTTDDAARFLSAPSYLRMIFVDARGVLALLWAPLALASDSMRRPPRDKTQWYHALVPPPWLASLLGARVMAAIPREAWRRVQRLSEANAFAPTPPFVVAPAVALLLYTNFEIFVFASPSPSQILALCAALRDAIRPFGDDARCELRYGPGKLFVDVAARARIPSLAPPIFAVLARVFGSNVRVAMHKGKAQVPSTAPLRHV